MNRRLGAAILAGVTLLTLAGCAGSAGASVEQTAKDFVLDSVNNDDGSAACAGKTPRLGSDITSVASAEVDHSRADSNDDTVSIVYLELELADGGQGEAIVEVKDTAESYCVVSATDGWSY